MNTPEEIAERSIAVYSTSLMGLVPSIQCLRETIAAAITARDAEWRAKFAAFCDETGEPTDEIVFNRGQNAALKRIGEELGLTVCTYNSVLGQIRILIEGDQRAALAAQEARG